LEPKTAVPQSARQTASEAKEPGHALVLVTALLFLGFSAWILSSSVRHPYRNWDMLTYAGAVAALELDDPVAIHERVYGKLAAAVDPAEYALLTRANEYRRLTSTDPRAFEQQLPYFRRRLLYVLPVAALARLGVEVFTATAVVSGLSVVAALWILFLAFRRRLATPWLLSIPLFLWLFGGTQLARLSTNHALAMTMIVLAGALYLRGSPWVLAVVPLSILARSDLLVFGTLLLGACALATSLPRLWIAASWLASIGVNFALDRAFRCYGWQTMFRHTFLQELPYPRDTEVRITPRAWLWAVRNLPIDQTNFLQNVPFLAAVVTTVLVAAAAWRTRGTAQADPSYRRRVLLLPLLSAAFFVAHFLLYPSISERYFAGSYVLAALGLVWLVAPRRPAAALAPRAGACAAP
jgi:hypothetical protein